MDATRISDGRPVMLKRLLNKEGPYELQINRLFSTEPLLSNPRNRCVQLLDVIELPNEPPIMVHPLLRLYNDPPLRTFGEFATFFAQLCEVNSPESMDQTVQLPREYNSCTRTMLLTGMFTIAFFYSFFPQLSGTAPRGTLCLTHRICIRSLFTPLT